MGFGRARQTKQSLMACTSNRARQTKQPPACTSKTARQTQQASLAHTYKTARQTKHILFFHVQGNLLGVSSARGGSHHWTDTQTHGRTTHSPTRHKHVLSTTDWGNPIITSRAELVLGKGTWSAQEPNQELGPHTFHVPSRLAKDQSGQNVELSTYK